MDTEYYYFECEVISKDMELIPFGRHTIQLPSKRIVVPMIHQIQELNKLNEEVFVTINRISKSVFDIKVHNNK